MLIKSEYDIQFRIFQPTPMVALLHLHPSVDPELAVLDGALAGVENTDRLKVENLGFNFGDPITETPIEIPVEDYLDSFGNRCSRFVAPRGILRLSGNNIIVSNGYPELQGFHLPAIPIEQLPAHTLQFLLASRYCEVDLFGRIAQDLFGHLGSGWALAASIRDWVHNRIVFDYKTARPTKTAMEAYNERIGVCRDYQHLAVTLSRCMNIPARYVTGYIGDIRAPSTGRGDFSAWYQVWLGDRWWDMDARHNFARVGRILMATGRDAADVAITTSFGPTDLLRFYVETYEIDAEGRPVPLPPNPSTIASGTLEAPGTPASPTT